MKVSLAKDVLDLLDQFQSTTADSKVYNKDIEGFKHWIVDKYGQDFHAHQPDWEGKHGGRTSESAIATMIVHMNRFGKNYFKAALQGSTFSTQEDVIYLIVLRFNKNLTKMDLIKKNVHEKPAGMQIIKRLIANGWVTQQDSAIDRRSKVLNITEKGIAALDDVMGDVRKATQLVSGNLSEEEKLQLLNLLGKLNDFHLPIYEKNISLEEILDESYKNLTQN